MAWCLLSRGTTLPFHLYPAFATVSNPL
jgi:hypothetical protein